MATTLKNNNNNNSANASFLSLLLFRSRARKMGVGETNIINGSKTITDGLEPYKMSFLRCNIS